MSGKKFTMGKVLEKIYIPPFEKKKIKNSQKKNQNHQYNYETIT